MARQADTISPAERLISISRTLREHGDTEDSQWLDSCLNRLFEGVPFDHAFHLQSAGVGKENALTRWRRHERNAFVRIAYGYIEGRSSNERIAELLKEIEKFESVYWPKYKDCEEPPPQLQTGLRLALWRAMRTGFKLPKKSQLWDIVT